MFENKKIQYESMKKSDEKFRNFCYQVFEDKTMTIEDSEKEHFYELSEIEHKDFEFRKRIFWPCCGLSLLLLDQFVTMPSTKGNKGRIVYNIIFGIPFVLVMCSGIIFYREKFESQEYAFTLCEKYKSCMDRID